MDALASAAALAAMSAMPGSSHKSPIDKLDIPCLVRVLQYVNPQQQLVACAAVCSKWRAATREAISSKCVLRCSQRKCDQLQQWLVHPPAALYKLSLIGHSRPVLRLQLSVLQHLNELKLDEVCLEAITAHDSVLTVVDLLPKLQHCTKVTIHAPGAPELTAAAAAFHAMSALQDLDFCSGEAGLSGRLVALPTTLTRLCLYSEGVINATSAEGICQLTGLRVLEVEAFGFDTSVLANCPGLEFVEIDIIQGGIFLSGFEEFTTPLLVFANMPNLKRLQLRCHGDIDDSVAVAADVAALSASSNLTYLSLGYSEYCALLPDAYDSWFPDGRRCPYLQHVAMGEWVLGNTEAVQRMVSACPGLQELELLSAFPSDDQPDSTDVAASLQALTNLTALTRLRVDGRQLPIGVCIRPAVIAAWSQMTSLQQLELQLLADWWPNNVQDVLRLTQLRSLRELILEKYYEAGSRGFHLLAIKGREECSPDVWRQLPSALCSAAIEHQQVRMLDLEEQQAQKQRAAAALLEEQQAAQRQVAALSQQLAAAEAHAAALCQQHAEAQSQLIELQQQQAAVHARVVWLLQQQHQADAERLRQEQQEEMAAMRQQAEAGQTQLQSQVSTLQAAVTALLQRKG